MIVKTMNNKELYKEVLKDFNNVDRYILNNVKKYRRMMLKSRNKHIDYVVEYTSPMKNKWLVNIKMDKKDFTYVGIVCDEGNFYMLGGDRTTISHYTPHFVDRYRERFIKDRTISLTEAMKFYMKRNNRSSYKGGGKTNEIFIKVKDGVCFGEVFGGGLFNSMKWVKYKTFITTDMLRDYQVNDVIDLHKNLKNYENFIEDTFGTIL